MTQLSEQLSAVRQSQLGSPARLRTWVAARSTAPNSWPRSTCAPRAHRWNRPPARSSTCSKPATRATCSPSARPPRASGSICSRMAASCSASPPARGLPAHAAAGRPRPPPTCRPAIPSHRAGLDRHRADAATITGEIAAAAVDIGAAHAEAAQSSAGHCRWTSRPPRNVARTKPPSRPPGRPAGNRRAGQGPERGLAEAGRRRASARLHRAAGSRRARSNCRSCAAGKSRRRAAAERLARPRAGSKRHKAHSAVCKPGKNSTLAVLATRTKNRTRNGFG
jgi:hypothetical protein